MAEDCKFVISVRG